MSQFLASLGRRPWAKPVVAGTLGIASLIHNLKETQTFGQKPGREYLSVYDENGKIEEISPKLQDLILSTLNDVRDKICIPIIPLDNKSFNASWFLTKLALPVTFGVTEMRWGLTIGLPRYFNYTDPNQLPSNLFTIENFSWLRQIWANIQQAKPQEERIVIQRHGSLGQELAECYTLSDRAKKFVIAREIFYVDTYRHAMFSLVNLFSCYMGLSGARLIIENRGAAMAHVNRRLSIYFIVGCVMFSFNRFVRRTAEANYIYNSDKDAAKINQDYYEGSLEYLQKMVDRRKVLLNAKKAAKVFPKELEDQIPFIIPRVTTFEERLANVRTLKEVEVGQ